MFNCDVVCERCEVMKKNALLNEKLKNLETINKELTITNNNMTLKYKMVVKKCANYVMLLSKIKDNLDMFSNFSDKSDFDRGFTKACEMMKNYLNQKYEEGGVNNEIVKEYYD